LDLVGVAPPSEKKKTKNRKNSLPRGWVKAFNDEGNVYYHNENSGMTQWDRPVTMEDPPQPTKSVSPPQAVQKAPSLPLSLSANTKSQNRPKVTAESTVEDICTFIASLQLSQDYYQMVRDQQLDGDVFLSLTEADLESLGVKVFGDRRKILKAVTSMSSGV